MKVFVLICLFLSQICSYSPIKPNNNRKLLVLSQKSDIYELEFENRSFEQVARITGVPLASQYFESNKNKNEKDLLNFVNKVNKLTKPILGEILSKKVFLISKTPSSKVKGRSKILDCLPLTSNCMISSAKAKIIEDSLRYISEKNNYQNIVGSTNSKSNSGFVKSLGFYNQNNGGVHVMEAGIMDLLTLLNLINGNGITKIDSDVLKILANDMSECVAKVHRSGYVWSDCRLENFVLCPTDAYTRLECIDIKKGSVLNDPNRIIKMIRSKQLTLKGIDLESAVKVGKPLTNFSPEILAPEQAEILSQGEMNSVKSGELQLNLPSELLQSDALKANKAIDVWALGICILHLYQGKAPIVTAANLSKAINKLETLLESNGGTGDAELTALGLADVQKKDQKLYKQLRKMLALEPKKRPDMFNVKRFF